MIDEREEQQLKSEKLSSSLNSFISKNLAIAELFFISILKELVKKIFEEILQQLKNQ